MSEHCFSEKAIAEDPILQYFDFKHLPAELQEVSSVFAYAASTVCGSVPRSAERTVCFRKLLEAKDCAVRAAL